MTRQLLITSSRTWRDEETARHWLLQSYIALGGGQVTLLSGNAEGGDKVCERIWEEAGQPVRRFKANWSGPCRETCQTGHRRGNGQGWSYCPAAGMYRNQEMVDQGPDLCLELRDPCAKERCRDRRKGHWSHGAEECAAMAERAGIVVWRVPA